MRWRAALLMMVVLGPTGASAQALRACTDVVTATGLASATVTATLPAGNSAKGKFIYLCSVYIVMAANAATPGAPGPAPICTATNMQPHNLIWWGDNGQMTQGTQKVVISRDWATGVRTAMAETPFSVSCAGGQSTQNIRINLTGFYGP